MGRLKRIVSLSSTTIDMHKIHNQSHISCSSAPMARCTTLLAAALFLLPAGAAHQMGPLVWRQRVDAPLHGSQQRHSLLHDAAQRVRANVRRTSSDNEFPCTQVHFFELVGLFRATGCVLVNCLCL